MKLGEYQAASDSFERALEMARRQQDTQAEQAIQKALEEVNDRIVRGEQGDEDKDEDETGEQLTGPRKLQSICCLSFIVCHFAEQV